MNNIIDFYSKDKIGTCIVSYYRSGTHYLSDNINMYLKSNNVGNINFGEVTDLLFTDTERSYGVVIVNALYPKVSLVKDQGLLENWLVVKLTRNDKVQHWISYYIWKYLNTEQQRRNNSNLPHHGGTKNLYANLPQTHCDMDQLKFWLLEQYLLNLFHSDISIDYADLPLLQGAEVQWEPNDYSITLQDLFTNYKEVEEYLTTYKVPCV